MNNTDMIRSTILCVLISYYDAMAVHLIQSISVWGFSFELHGASKHHIDLDPLFYAPECSHHFRQWDQAAIKSSAEVEIC
jgi:hypothetical protein